MSNVSDPWSHCLLQRVFRSPQTPNINPYYSAHKMALLYVLCILLDAQFIGANTALVCYYDAATGVAIGNNSPTTSTAPNHAQLSSSKSSRFYRAVDNELSAAAAGIVPKKILEFSLASSLLICGCYDESNNFCARTVYNKSVKTRIISYVALWARVDVVACPREYNWC